MTRSEQEIIAPGFLNSIGEHFLAGHVACSAGSPMLKMATGLREWFTHVPLHVDSARQFAPATAWRDGAYRPHFNGQIIAQPDVLLSSLGDEPTVGANCIVDAVREYWETYSPDMMWQGHATLDYATILQHGLPHYRQRIEEGLHGAQDAQKAEFFQSLALVMDGIDGLIRRYIAEYDGRIADAVVDDSANVVRARACFAQMLVGPPRDFFEALQYLHFFNAVDGFDNAGRMDQYLYPFFVRDQERGALSEAAAEELLVELLDIWGSVTFWNIVVGGTDQDGVDVSNPLTYIIMRARGRVQRPNPNLSLRLPSHGPDELLMAAFDVLQQGQSQPAIYNDDLYVDTLEELGVPRADAAELVFGGCSETHIGGKGSIRDAYLNMVTPLRTALGLNTRMSGSSAAAEEFDSLMAAYKAHVRSAIDEHVDRRNATQKALAEYQPALVRSIFVSGCIESGTSNTGGGALYNHGMIDVYGVPNVANSLYAIKKLVYEEQAVSLSTLCDALAANFDGYEELRRLCRGQARYGNDDSAVDALARETSDYIFSYIQEHRLWNGGIFYGFCASAGEKHVAMGKDTGATPDGRLAGLPLASSMGPVQGTDGEGPTATLNSVSTLDLSKAIGTPVVNLSFEKEMFVEHKDAVAALIRVFFRKGGMQLQFNLIDREMLMAALECPEEHRDLIVRVSGYSARFADLSRACQEEIVERTVHAA